MGTGTAAAMSGTAAPWRKEPTHDAFAMLFELQDLVEKLGSSPTVQAVFDVLIWAPEKADAMQ